MAFTVSRPAGETLAKAHERATRAGIAGVAAELQRILGQRVVALLAGVQDSRLVGKWARGEHSPRPEAEQRLRAAVQVAWLLLQFDSPATVRAWFLGMNPHLDDRSPALVIAEGSAADRARVLQAAKSFIASG